MKNILFIADSFMGGGLETRIIGQVNFLKKKKIPVYLICREYSHSYDGTFDAVSDALQTHTSTTSITAKNILNDVNAICAFCKEHDIKYIDCHPFWCTLPAALAAEKLKIPISFTLHGVISADFIDNKYTTAKTLYQLVFSYGFDRLFAVAEYLSDLYPYLPIKTILHNGFSASNIKNKKFQPTGNVAVVSRLDEVKTQLIIDFLPSLYEQKVVKKIDIYGNGEYYNQLADFINQNHYEDKISLLGWEKDVSDKIYKSDYMAVFGMGRVIVETIEAGVPAGVLGYGGFAGFVDHNNLIGFSKTNLTSWNKAKDSLEKEFNQLFKMPDYYLFNKQDLSDFESENIWKLYYETIISINHTEKVPSQTIAHYLEGHPDINILTDEELLLSCVRLLSDGSNPISPRLFYALFQKQFDEICELKQQVAELSTSIPKKIYHKIIKSRKTK
ncbi:glycosyltransferase [Candidatus Saccharibacteria bacterium]|nr:glycosyltransferase [Candidatus Saccharibacteria bacterium]